MANAASHIIPLRIRDNTATNYGASDDSLFIEPWGEDDRNAWHNRESMAHGSPIINNPKDSPQGGGIVNGSCWSNVNRASSEFGHSDIRSEQMVSDNHQTGQRSIALGDYRSAFLAGINDNARRFDWDDEVRSDYSDSLLDYDGQVDIDMHHGHAEPIAHGTTNLRCEGVIGEELETFDDEMDEMLCKDVMNDNVLSDESSPFLDQCGPSDNSLSLFQEGSMQPEWFPPRHIHATSRCSYMDEELQIENEEMLENPWPS